MHFPGGTVDKNLLTNAGSRVRSLVSEDPTCQGATKALSHNSQACVLHLLKPISFTHKPKAYASQQEKPLQWEACALWWGEAPDGSN